MLLSGMTMKCIVARLYFQEIRTEKDMTQSTLRSLSNLFLSFLATEAEKWLANFVFRETAREKKNGQGDGVEDVASDERVQRRGRAFCFTRETGKPAWGIPGISIAAQCRNQIRNICAGKWF